MREIWGVVSRARCAASPVSFFFPYPQEPRVDIGLYHGMDLAMRGDKVWILGTERLLLCIDEGVRVGVEPVVGKEADREGASDALVLLGQGQDSSTQGFERCCHLLGVHLVCQHVAGVVVGDRSCPAAEEGIGPLGAEDIGTLLFAVREELVRQIGERLLSKEAVGDECRHEEPRFQLI